MHIKDLNVLKVRKINAEEEDSKPYEVVVKEVVILTFGDESLHIESTYKAKSMVELKVGPQLLWVRPFDFTDEKTKKRIVGITILKPYDQKK